MKWYCAHMIIFFELKDEPDQAVFPVWENVVIFRGGDLDDIRQKAELQANLDDSVCDETLTWKGRPVARKFGGIRKIVECDPPLSRPAVEESVVVEGTEVTYSEFLVDSKENLAKLIAGDAVRIVYES